MIRRRSAFTLIELLIVIAIIGILIAAIAVAVTKAKEFANNNDQKSNMKNMATACRTMEVQFGRLPPAWANPFGRPPQPGGAATSTSSAPSVFVYMLPFLENKALYDSNVFTGTTVRVFLSLMDPSLPSANAMNGHTSFVANIRVFSTYGSIFDYNVPVPMTIQPPDPPWKSHFTTDNIADGAGNTVFFTTKYAVCNQQPNLFHRPPHDSSAQGAYFGGAAYSASAVPSQVAPAGVANPVPYQIAPTLATSSTNGTHCNNDRGIFGHSFGGSGLAVAMGDTSVRNLSFTLTGETFARAICPGEGKPLGTDW